VSVTFRQGEGARAGGTGTRGIASITAGVVTTSVGAVSSLQVGDIAEIFGSTEQPTNNGFYTVTAIAGLTITLRPAPLNQVAGGANDGSIARLGQATERIASRAVTSVIELSAGVAVIRSDGALFRTNNVEVNDRVAFRGSATTANNGAWYVQEVLSESQIAVRPPDFGTGMTAQGADGTLQVRAGVHVFDVVGEPAVSWQLLQNASPQNGPSGGAPFFGSGAGRDYFRKYVLPDGLRTVWNIFGVSRIRFNQSSLGVESSWIMENEDVTAITQNSRGASGDAFVTRLDATGAWDLPGGNGMDIRLGSQPGNEFSVANGSVLVGIRVFAAGLFTTERSRISMYGSYMDPLSPLLGNFEDGEVVGSIVREGLRAGEGRVESVALYGSAVVGSFGFLSMGNGDQNNILVAEHNTQSSITGAGAEVGGVLWADTIVVPALVNSSGATIFIRNPKQDVPLLSFYDTIGGDIERIQEFNPIFSSVAGTQLVPIAGLAVSIVEINNTTLAEVVAFAGATDVNGRLNGGLGVDLRRELLELGPVSTFFTHRVVYSAREQYVVMHDFERNEWGPPGGGTLFGSPPGVDVLIPTAQAATPQPVAVPVDLFSVDVEPVAVAVAVDPVPVVHIDAGPVVVPTCLPSPFEIEFEGTTRYVEKVSVDQVIPPATTAVIAFDSPDVGGGFLLPNANGVKNFFVLYTLLETSSPSAASLHVHSVRVGAAGSAADAEVFRCTPRVFSGATSSHIITFLVRVDAPSSTDVVTLVVTTQVGQTLTVRGSGSVGVIRSTLLIWEESP